MDSNLAIVDEWPSYHRAVIDEIDRYLASEQLQRSLLTVDGIDCGGLMKRGLIQDFCCSAPPSDWERVFLPGIE